MTAASSTGIPPVAVTGIGLMTGLGMGRERTWKGLREGRSAGRVLDPPAPAGESPYVGFPIDHPDHRPREIFFKAGIEAVSDARVRAGGDPTDRDRAGTVVGFSKGDLRT